jgi:Zn-dependent protease
MDMGMLLVAAAGPISNVVLAAVTLFLMNVLHALDVAVAPLFQALLTFTLQINVILAVFNLLPVPPLDGSRIADALMPEPWRPAWNSFCSLGAAPLVALIVVPSILGISLFGWILDAVVRLIP